MRGLLGDELSDEHVVATPCCHHDVVHPSCLAAWLAEKAQRDVDDHEDCPMCRGRLSGVRCKLSGVACVRVTLHDTIISVSDLLAREAFLQGHPSIVQNLC